MKEWQEEAVRRFGKDPEDWKFICPACGRVNTGEEFKEAGAEPDDMYCNCIGRFNGHMVPASKSKGHGCDWAAYGLFGTMGKGVIVVKPDGKEFEVFDFAPAEGGEHDVSAAV